VFSYTEENVGLFAAESAVSIAEALIAGIEYDLESDLQKMREIRERVRLGPSTGSIVEEAVSRSIPWIRLGTNSLVQLGHGINQMRFQATITCKQVASAVDMACNKELTKCSIWLQFRLPLEVSVDEEDLAETINKIGYL
jgi:cyanophycin synthetase